MLLLVLFNSVFGSDARLLFLDNCHVNMSRKRVATWDPFQSQPIFRLETALFFHPALEKDQPRKKRLRSKGFASNYTKTNIRPLIYRFFFGNVQCTYIVLKAKQGENHRSAGWQKCAAVEVFFCRNYFPFTKSITIFACSALLLRPGH